VTFSAHAEHGHSSSFDKRLVELEDRRTSGKLRCVSGDSSYPGGICGRFTSTLGPDEIGRQLGRPLGFEIRERAGTGAYNIAPTDPVLTIVAPDGAAEARAMRWALVPAYAKTVKTPRPWINAKVEGLRTKGSYLGVTPEAAHRALIVGDGFFEWPKPEDEQAKRKLKPAPFRFQVDDGKAFVFAALWTTARHVENGPIESTTMLTCDATGNRVVAPIHDRMPVILADIEQMKAWLDPAVSPAEALTLCEPLDANRMSASVASKAVNNVNSPDGPDLLLPTEVK
jgi:putative SOS response-associated peptidase YedK